MYQFTLVLLIGVSLMSCAGSSGESLHIRQSEECAESFKSLSKVAPDTTYGFSKENAVRVGGGPRYEYLYLSKLAGPNGEALDSVNRIGSVGSTDQTGRLLLLDGYELFFAGTKYDKLIFLDMYNCEEQFIPMGLTKRSE